MTKIMLVEDDKGLREIYGVRLLAEGYDIVSAGDGEEALAMAIKERPQLIISDVMMPKISGFDMLDILRSTTETKNIHVIMMTALSSDEQRLRGEQLGADKYLVKSQVGIEDVVKAVHEVLDDKPGSQEATNPLMQAKTVAPPAAFDTAVTSLSTEAEGSTIPQPTAPFTGQRPTTLGDRVIQPLKDNPRVSSVDVGELMNKEFAANVQNIEDTPDPSAPEPVTTPLGSMTSTSNSPPIQSSNAVSMDPPSPPQPAADDMIDLASLAAPAPPTAAPALTTYPATPPTAAPAAPPQPAPVTVVDAPAAVIPPATQSQPATQAPAAAGDRANQPITAPERTPPTIPSYE